jgi:hypothetical protein
MLNYNILSLITEGKRHPDLHCDVDSGEIFVAQRAARCKREYCSVASGTSNYHIDCATYFLGIQSSLCECGECVPRYSCYFPRHLRNGVGRPRCPWCQKNCKITY